MYFVFVTNIILKISDELIDNIPEKKLTTEKSPTNRTWHVSNQNTAQSMHTYFYNLKLIINIFDMSFMLYYNMVPTWKKIYLFQYIAFIYFLDDYIHVNETIITTPKKSHNHREKITDNMFQGQYNLNLL